MLTVSNNFVNAINETNRKYNVIVNVYRNTSGGVNPAIDISDRVISYQSSHDFESRGGRLNLEIDNYDYMLSPLNRTSPMNLVSGMYDPLLDSNHIVVLYEGVLISGNTYEYVRKFEGYMGDQISASSDPVISISCRDKSKLLQDTYIYQGPSYSLYLVEDVIQDLLDQFVPHLGITLQVQDPTQYMIGRPDSPYAPKDTNLWDAIQMLADSASQELRFMEDGSLIIRKVVQDFSSMTPNLDLGMSNLITDSMDVSDSDVRNYIVVKVQDFDPITKSDDVSIAKYGMRYMEVQRSMSDLITDVSQAHELAENILKELRFANPNESVEIPLHPLVQVGDIVKITNPRLGTNPNDDIFKVLSVDNDYSNNKKRTRLTLKGHDIFLSTPDIAPSTPMGWYTINQVRTIQNYPNSGWEGYEKEIYFPMIQWTPTTRDISGNVLPDNFGGYIIERGTQLNREGTATQVAWNWGTIASIPSYIASLNKKVDYFYDYSAPAILDKYEKAGTTSTIVELRYRIRAISKKGTKSGVSTELSVYLPVQKTKDSNGNYL